MKSDRDIEGLVCSEAEDRSEAEPGVARACPSTTLRDRP